jgi:hypothetical protein
MSSQAYGFPTLAGPEKIESSLIPGVIAGYLAAAISTRESMFAEA